MALEEIGNMLDSNNKLKINKNDQYLLDLIQKALSNAKSAYDLWLEQGNTGTITEFLNSLKGSNAVIENGTVEPENTTFISVGKNQFDLTKVHNGMLLDAYGKEVVSTSYSVTHPIYLKQGETLTINKMRNAAFYNMNDTLNTFNGTGTAPFTFTAQNDGYIKYSIYNTDVNTTQIEYGSSSTTYERYRLKLRDDIALNVQIPDQDITIEDKSITPEKTSFIEIGKNLYNINAISVDSLLGANGTLTTSTSYDVSDYIFVPNGKSVTTNKFRNLGIFDLNKVIKNYVGTASTNYTYTATYDSYIRISTTKADAQNVQVEYGTTATAYEPYYMRLSSNISTGSVSVDASSNYVVTKKGSQIDLKTILNGKNLEIRTKKDGSMNNSFTFDRTIYDGTLIHATGDDITPVRTWTTVGANHGDTSIIDLPNTDKTVLDLGSTWTDGTTTYTLLRIVNNRLLLACPVIAESDGRYTSKLVAPVNDLTHVANATNTSNISKTGYISTSQLYPSIGKISVEYIADGIKINDDGDYKANEVTINEKYTILDFKSIVDWAQLNVGKDFATARDSIDGLLEISNTFQFYGKGLCTTSHSIKILKKVLLGQTGVLQSVALEHPSLKVWRFVPNTLQIGTVDFTKPIDLSTYSTSNLVTKDKLNDPNKPTNRYVDYIMNGTTPLVAFSLGHIVDKTNSKHADRLSNVSSVLWDFRNTKKSYPTVIHNKVFDVGSYLTFEGYRNYFIPKNNVINTNTVRDKTSRYIYIDETTVKNFNSVEYAEYLGGVVTVIESNNFTLKSDVIDSNGLNYSINAANGYAILKIS